MSNFPRLFIGAFHRQELVGVVIGSFDGRMKGWINRLAVSPKHRRKGIAHQLIKAVERALERRGVAIFCALIETPNEESLNVFKNWATQLTGKFCMLASGKVRIYEAVYPLRIILPAPGLATTSPSSITNCPFTKVFIGMPFTDHPSKGEYFAFE